MALCWKLLTALAMLGSFDGPSLGILMALAMLGSLDGPSLEASHGPLLCLGAWMALR